MVKTDTVIDDVLWFRYDMESDVLYLRLTSERDSPTVAEETLDGFLMLRRESDDQPVGLTVVNWWKRFGKGALPDRISELQQIIEPWAKRVA